MPAILKADLDAIGDRDVYDDAYFDAFFRATPAGARAPPQRIDRAVAAMIAGAWEAAGRPPRARSTRSASRSAGAGVR